MLVFFSSTLFISSFFFPSFFLVPLAFKFAAQLSQARFLCHCLVSLICDYYWVVYRVDMSRWHAALSALGGHSYIWQNPSGPSLSCWQRNNIWAWSIAFVIVRYCGCCQVCQWTCGVVGGLLYSIPASICAWARPAWMSHQGLMLGAGVLGPQMLGMTFNGQEVGLH